MTVFRGFSSLLGVMDKVIFGLARHVKKCNTQLVCACFALLTTIMSILSVSFCTFATGVSGVRPDGRHTVGLYSMAVYDVLSQDSTQKLLGCVNFHPHVHLDGWFKMSRMAGSTMAASMTGTFLLLIWIVFFKPSIRLWKFVRYGLTLATISSLFTFCLMRSSHCQSFDCRLTGVGVGTIFNAFIMAGLTTIVWLEQAPSHPIFEFWTEQHFIARRDTLPSVEGGDSEYVSSQENNAAVFDQKKEQASFQNKASTNHQQADASIISEPYSAQRSINFHLLFFGALLLTWLMGLLGIRHCTYINIGPHESRAIDGSSLTMSIGLYSRAYYISAEKAGCIDYTEDAKADDIAVGYFQVARIAGAVSSMLLSIVLATGFGLLFFNTCRIELWLFIRCLLPVAGFTHVMTLLVYKSNLCSGRLPDMECTPGTMGYVVLANTMLIFILTGVSWYLPPPSNPVFVRYPVPGVAGQEEEHQELVSTTSSVSSINSKTSTTSKRKKKKKSFGGSGSNKAICSIKSPSHCPLGTIIDEESTVYSEATAEGAAQVSLHVETINGERKVIQTIQHPDGTKMMTTTIFEDFTAEEGAEDDGELAYGEDEDSMVSEALSESDNQDQPARGSKPLVTKARNSSKDGGDADHHKIT